MFSFKGAHFPKDMILTGVWWEQDNLDLERWFKQLKGHERRIHGCQHAGVRSFRKAPHYCWPSMRTWRIQSCLWVLIF